MKRPAGLQSARDWIARLTPVKNIVKSYAKWFGVDLRCAIIELRMLGVEISEEYEKQVITSIELKVIERRKRKEARAEPPETDPYAVWDWEYIFDDIDDFPLAAFHDEVIPHQADEQPEDDELPL